MYCSICDFLSFIGMTLMIFTQQSDFFKEKFMFIYHCSYSKRETKNRSQGTENEILRNKKKYQM